MWLRVWVRAIGLWFALSMAFVGSPTTRAQVVINEILYEPAEPTSKTEFVELYNAGAQAVDLGRWFLSGGIFFEFPRGTTLPAGGYLVVAENPVQVRIQFGVTALGPFQGRLSNEGDLVTLRDPAGNPRDEVDYQVGFPWPTASSGQGASIELTHPSLDNSLGGSWRASLVPSGERNLPEDPIVLVSSRENGWRYRKGLSEPSEPRDAWRKLEFKEDESWQTGQASIGYADDDDFTLLDDMRSAYPSVYLRKTFSVRDPGALPALKLWLYVDDGCIVWLNNHELPRHYVSGGDKACSDTSGGGPHEAAWEELRLSGGPSDYLVAGTNLVAVHLMNSELGSSDLSFDLKLFVPAAQRAPTPGARNSVFADNGPPQIRQVSHTPTSPRSEEPVLITAKVTDPDGVQSVTLEYQVVAPGAYMPAFLPLPHDLLLAEPDTPLSPNPEFEDAQNWFRLEMTDDGFSGDAQAGDGLYSALLAGQPNRTLIRYRIVATDSSTPAQTVRVPYPDDRSLNFALFVYDGVPPYKPGSKTVHPDGLGHEYSHEVLNSVAVYSVLAREQDWLEAHAYDRALRIPQWGYYPATYHPAYDNFNWECTLVYEGKVYDHVRFRLRQANSRYLHPGKRALRFRFNPGNRFQARDESGHPYPVRWRTLNLGKLFDNLGIGNFGMVEAINSRLWEVMGVPTPATHYVHLRVIDGIDEAPATVDGQYAGDFWGLYLAMEDYDAGFLKARQMPDGNLYKLKAYVTDATQLDRHKGRDSVTSDADFQNIYRNFGPKQSDNWLRAHLNWDLWYRYYAVADAVRHMDYSILPSHMKNQAWFFEPSAETPLGRLWVLPWDSDISWGPAWVDSGWDHAKWAMFNNDGIGHPAMKTEFRSAIREFRDLVWREDVINPMIDRLASSILELSRADRDRWRDAPNGNDFGSIEDKVQNMKNFAFVEWKLGDYVPVGAGGRAAYLDAVAGQQGETTLIPNTPVIRYAGPAGFPVDELIFQVDPFRDPQGDATFGAIRWRVAEVTDPSAPAYDPNAPPLFEWSSVWQSPDETQWSGQCHVPGQKLLPGHAYRARARVRDDTGRWSHWSEPVQFAAGLPKAAQDTLKSLRITEVMYHAPGDDPFDYIELANVGSSRIDLGTTRLQGEVEFVFAEGSLRQLAPGERLLLVEDLLCFGQRYPNRLAQVAGEFKGRLSNRQGYLTLDDSWTGGFAQYAYNDRWYPSTDGAGCSLILSDPTGSVDLARTKAGWKPSVRAFGSPGTNDEPEDQDEDGLPDAWELRHGFLTLDKTDAEVDTDGDGQPNKAEYIAGTDPRDASSLLHIDLARLPAGMAISFPTSAAQPEDGYDAVRFYAVERRHGVGGVWETVDAPHAGNGVPVVVVDPFRPDRSLVFYRLTVWLAPW